MWIFFFLQGFFSQKSGKFRYAQFKMKPRRPWINFYIKYVFRKYYNGGHLLQEIYLVMVKWYTASCYIHLIWNINIWKVPKWWCCHLWDLWLMKVKVTIRSFLLHLSKASISWHIFQLLNNGAPINCVIIFKFKQTS